MRFRQGTVSFVRVRVRVSVSVRVSVGLGLEAGFGLGLGLARPRQQNMCAQHMCSTVRRPGEGCD